MRWQLAACLMVGVQIAQGAQPGPAADIAQLSQQGAAATRAGRFAEAAGTYRRLIALDPATPHWQLNLGLALQGLSQHREAAAAFEQFVKKQPQPGPAHLMLGLSRLKLREFCPAVAPLEKARQWDAARSTLELADAYQGCQRWEPAARAYVAAAKFRPGDAAVIRGAAYCFWRARLYSEARPHFQSLLPRYRADAEFNYEFGDMLVRLEGPEAGLDLLRAAARSAPQLLGARAELGKALLETGAADEALPHLEAAVAQDPALLLPLSKACRAVGRVADADRYAQEYRQRMKQ
ncbi:MAG: tetratricopeptide repeat protein [Acidobacteria bacterium]|nr:tetratricopeptide repeat protein [Acidobacteriota bacterium]